MVAGADKLGDASMAVTKVGLIVGGAGIVTGNPVLSSLGVSGLEAGGIIGVGSGNLQILGGIAQRLGGGGWHNTLAGTVSLGTGVVISKALNATIPHGWSGATRTAAETQNSVAGNILGALQGLADWFKPAQVSCPK